MKIKSLFALVLVIVFNSCSPENENVDTKAPIIAIINPVNGQVVEKGQPLNVDLQFNDNFDLASYKVDIHFSGDGHSHNDKLMNSDSEIEWNYEQTGVLSNEFDSKQFTIQVPENIKSGIYHFGVYALDKAGNQNVVFVEIDVH